MVRLAVWLVSHGLFKLRVAGRENVPARGAALLASNHVTYVDGFLIWSCVPRPIRFLVWKPFFGMTGVRWVLRLIRAVPVGEDGPHDMRESIRKARLELMEGHLVCIFPEGSLTRSGEILPFKRGMELIAHEMKVPIIPVHLGGLWESIFSLQGGKAFWKWPQRLPHPATVSFGEPMSGDSSADEVHKAVQVLATAAEGRSSPSNRICGDQCAETEPQVGA